MPTKPAQQEPRNILDGLSRREQRMTDDSGLPEAAITDVSLDRDGRGIVITDTRADGVSARGEGPPVVHCRFARAPQEITDAFYLLLTGALKRSNEAMAGILEGSDPRADPFRDAFTECWSLRTLAMYVAD